MWRSGAGNFVPGCDLADLQGAGTPEGPRLPTALRHHHPHKPWSRVLSTGRFQVLWATDIVKSPPPKAGRQSIEPVNINL